MTPRWHSPLDAPSPRDAALLAEVLDALGAQLEGATPAGDDDERDELTELISAAVAELHRVAPSARAEGGVAPVLGAGVLQELLRRRRHPQAERDQPSVHIVDQRL